MIPSTVIEVDVRHEFPGFSLEVSFTSERGGVTALFGPSGAGKTTLVDMMAGLTRPNAGRIAVGGRILFDSDAGVDLRPERRRIGYVFQESRLFPHLSVGANLSYGMRRLPAAERRVDRDRVIELLGIGHLTERRPHHLSGGEKQRVAIGRALLTSPRLLLMDEPLAGIDVARRSEILPFIEGLRDELGIPIVYVSHNADEIIRLADTVVLVAEGRAVAVGPVEEMMARPDLGQLTGGVDAGAVVPVTVTGHDSTYELTKLAFAGGTLLVSRLNVPVGTRQRVRVFARDVAIAIEAPTRISTLNVFHGTVHEVTGDTGPQRDVLIDIGCMLWARITRRSADELGVAPGREVYALIKTVALDRYSTIASGGGP